MDKKQLLHEYINSILESENLTEEIVYRTVDFNKLLEIDPDLEYELESRCESKDYRLIYKRFLRSKTGKLRLNYYQLDLIAYIYEDDDKFDQISELLYGKQVNEWADYKDVTIMELNTNPCKFVVIDPSRHYSDELSRSEYDFNNLKEVFKYVSDCGGFNTFKGFKWYILSTYKDGEFYYTRERFSKGGWAWIDCNGNKVQGTEWRSVRGLKEYHNYKNLNSKIGSSDYDIKCIEYWKDQIQKGNHRPILLNKDDKVILDGNHTLTAYQELNIEPSKVYQGTREEFYKHVAATKTIDAIDAINDMIADGSAELLEWGEETLEDIKIREFIRTIKDAYGDDYKIPEKAGYRALENMAKSAQKVINKRQPKQEIKTSTNIKSNNKPAYTKPKGKIIGYNHYKNNNFLAYFENGGTSILSYEQIKPYLDYQDLNDLDREQYDLDHLNESERLNEYSIADVINDSKSSDPRRIELAKSLYTEYKGVDSDGTLLFETDSQTRSGLGHKQQIFYPGFFDMLDKVDQNEEITEEDVLNILTGDLSLKCSCESFLYFAWAYKSWKNNYGLMKETRAPKRNNVNLNGGACKHCLSVLELINRSNTLFDKIAKDLNILFQHYKKQNMTQKEIERLQNELKNMKSPNLKSQDNNDNISDTNN